jgi:hypothetical protein
MAPAWSWLEIRVRLKWRMVGTRRDLQSCNACPCHIMARRSNPQQTSTLFLLGPRTVMTVACMHSHCSNSFVVVPMFPVPATSANLPPPRVETGQGNWKIVGSLRQFAIFCGLLGSPSLSPSPFTSTLAGSQAQITRPGILLAPRQHDVAVPPCRAYARIVKGRARVVGVWSLDLWFGRRFASKPACACACLGA